MDLRSAELPSGTSTPGRRKSFPRICMAASAAAILALSLMAGCKSKQAAPPTDQQLTSAIQAKIQNESALNGQNIQVAVSNGIATLSGTVIDDASRALAGNDSGAVPGVRTVVNNLTVQPRQQATAPAPAPPPEQQATHEPTHESHPEHPRHDRSRRRLAQTQQMQPEPPPSETQPQHEAYNAPPPVENTPPPMHQAPPPPPRPVVHRVTLPAGTLVPVILTEALDTKTARANDVFHGTLAASLMSHGMVAIPRGAQVLGQVVDAKEAGHFTGHAFISLDLTQLSAYGRTIGVQTDTFSQQGNGRGKNTAEKSGGGALFGAVLGALAGGGKGAAIGALAGGGAGAGVNAITRGKEIQIPSETRLEFHLQTPVTLTVTTPTPGAPVNPPPTLQQR